MDPQIPSSLQLSSSESEMGEMRTSWCIFCLQKCEAKSFFSESATDEEATNNLMTSLKSLQRFINLPKLISLLFNDNGDEDNWPFHSCRDCLLLLQDFCDVYKEIQLLEMKANLKLDTLCAIITSSENVSLRIETVKRSIRKGDHNRRLENLQHFRSELVTKATAQIKAALPKVKVKKRKVTLSTLFPLCNIKAEPVDEDLNMDTSEQIQHQQEQDSNNPEALMSPASGPDDGEDVASNYSYDFNTESNSDVKVEAMIKPEPLFENGLSEIVQSDPETEVGLPTRRRSKRKCTETISRISKTAKVEKTNSTAKKGLLSSKSEAIDTGKCKEYLQTPQQSSQHGLGVRRKAKAEHEQNKRLKKSPTCKMNVKPSNSDKPSNNITNYNWQDYVPLSPSARKLFGPPIECKVGKCKRFFYKQEELDIHAKHHDNFKCNFCEEEVDYSSKLPIHELTHCPQPKQEPESKKLFTCSRCTFSTMTRNLLIFHFIEDHLNLPVDYCTCPICNKGLYAVHNTRRSFRQNLRAHMLEAHDFTKTIYECKMEGCVAYFNTEKHLAVHKNSHKFNVKFTAGMKKIFECKICRKRWSTKDKLQTHYRRVCSKTINMVPEVEETEVEETMESFTCQQCGEILNSQEAMNDHVTIVHGLNAIKPKKKYMCDLCGRNFKAGAHLKTHLLSHSGPESWEFSCNICGKRSMTKQNLNEHFKTHSKEKPFTCELCGSSFSTRHNLTRHYKRIHNDISNSNKSAKNLTIPGWFPGKGLF